MKKFKHADLVLQVLVLVLGFLANSIDSEVFPLVYLYFVVGGWQLISFLIHLFINDSWKATRERTAYAKTLVWMIGVGLFCLLLLLAEIPVLILYLFALLFVSPVLAIWYFSICQTEWRILKRKELIHLK
ncbi:MAG: hypothetical protein NTW29_10320 [Bacteroidetes bacterium]|nr:hypothetical protein [Bacteroidota bacterium]